MDVKYDLSERLIKFSILVIEISESIHRTFAGKALASQISRSGTSPTLNYGEALSAESRKDFIHKMRIILKELRETSICLQIIKRKPLIPKQVGINNVISECSELVAIFTASIKTAKNKLEN